MRRKRKVAFRPGDPITTELACWVYCPEQWWLHYGLGLEPANLSSRRGGDKGACLDFAVLCNVWARLAVLHSKHPKDPKLRL